MQFDITGIGGDAIGNGLGDGVARRFRPQHQRLTLRHGDIALPVELQPSAGIPGIAVVGIGVGGDGGTVGNTQSLIEQAQHQMRRGAPVILQQSDARLGWRGKAGEGFETETIAGDFFQRAVGSPDKAQIEKIGDVIAQLGRAADAVVIIAIGFFAWQQQRRRRYRRIAGMLMGERKAIVELIAGAADTGVLVEGVKAAAVEMSGGGQGPLAVLGDHINHPPNGVRAIKPGARSAQHFYPCDVGGVQFAEIKDIGGGGGIGDINSVQQYLGVVGIGAAGEDRGLAALPAGLHDIEARHIAQHIGQRDILMGFDVGGGDQGDRTGDLILRCGDASGGDDDAFGPSLRIVLREGRRHRRDGGGCT